MSSPIEILKEAEDKVLKALEDMSILEKHLIYRQLHRSERISMDGIDHNVEKYSRELANRANSYPASPTFPVPFSGPNGPVIIPCTSQLSSDDCEKLEAAWKIIVNVDWDGETIERFSDYLTKAQRGQNTCPCCNYPDCGHNHRNQKEVNTRLDDDGDPLPITPVGQEIINLSWWE